MASLPRIRSLKEAVMVSEVTDKEVVELYWRIRNYGNPHRCQIEDMLECVKFYRPEAYAIIQSDSRLLAA